MANSTTQAEIAAEQAGVFAHVSRWEALADPPAAKSPKSESLSQGPANVNTLATELYQASLSQGYNTVTPLAADGCVSSFTVTAAGGKGDMKKEEMATFFDLHVLDRLGQNDGDSQSMHFNGDGDSVQAQAGDSPGDSQLGLESESELEIDEWPEDDPSEGETARIKEEDDRIGEMLPHLFAPGWDAFLSQNPVPAKTMTNAKMKQIIKDKVGAKPKARPKPKASSSSPKAMMKVTAMKAQKAAKAKNSGQKKMMSGNS